MSKDTELPHEMIHTFTDPLARFFKIQAAAAVLLLFSTIISVILTNSGWSNSFQKFWQIQAGLHVGSFVMSYSLHSWINDGLMTLFFFVIALEMKRELVLGELRNPKIAFLPLAGAVGGMLFPALIFFMLMKGKSAEQGWGAVMATDTAFLAGCLTLLGKRVPPSLRLFLLSLAIFDDIGAILVIAFFYGHAPQWLPLGCGLLGFAIIAAVSRLGVRTVPFYSIIGIFIWACFKISGLHPTLVGVVLGLMTPTVGWVSDQRMRSILTKVLSYPTGPHWSGDTADRRDLGRASAAARETLSPVERLGMILNPFVGFAIVPIFALANAAATFSMSMLKQPVSWSIVISLVFGKPIGVLVMSFLAVHFGMARLFLGLNWSLIAAGSILTGIGFTMSLFIAELAFEPSSLASAKFGILMASIISATLGTFTLAWLIIGKGKKN